jgi:hypothetical protein
MTNARTVKIYAVLAVLLALGFLLLAGAAEFAYRLRLRRQLGSRPASYRVAPSMYVEYDAEHGERFKPNHELWVTYVENGRVVWGTTTSRSNADGLGGRTTLADYDSSAVKILVFGDSFTHWNQGNATWPDLLQDQLQRRLGASVGVLDFARGAYGVIQMLELAAEKAPELRPDLVVIAPIGDDFSRARWWCKEVQRDGVTRWMLTSKDGAFLDYRYAVDELLIDPRATPGWCDSTWHAGGYDPVVASLNARYASLSREIWAVRPPVDLFTPRDSYLLARLLGRDPFTVRRRTLPRVTFSDYRADEGASRAVATLRSLHVPIMLVYLPVTAEVKARKAMMPPQARRLKRSLERELGTSFEELEVGYPGPAPVPFDLRPFDRHPSRTALEFYATNVAGRCLRSYLRALVESTAARP